MYINITLASAERLSRPSVLNYDIMDMLNLYSSSHLHKALLRSSAEQDRKKPQLELKQKIQGTSVFVEPYLGSVSLVYEVLLSLRGPCTVIA